MCSHAEDIARPSNACPSPVENRSGVPEESILVVMHSVLQCYEYMFDSAFLQCYCIVTQFLFRSVVDLVLSEIDMLL